MDDNDRLEIEAELFAELGCSYSPRLDEGRSWAPNRPELFDVLVWQKLIKARHELRELQKARPIPHREP